MEPQTQTHATTVKIGLQLYKVQQHIYLLDFQKLGGDAFTYMNLCARIITELKTLSGVRPLNASHDLNHQPMIMHGHTIGSGDALGPHPVYLSRMMYSINIYIYIYIYIYII